MNWKLFITACVNAAVQCFPANGITCGPTEDPHDYFTSFFSNQHGTEPAYRPFYYTALLKFYDADEYWMEQEDSLDFVNKEIVEEWKAYGKASANDAIQLVYQANEGELQALAESSKSGKATPAALAGNSLAQNLVKEKKTAAINYLAFARKTGEAGTSNQWEDRRKDSTTLDQFITEATGFYTQTTDPFLKNKYAFQRCKLAFYNNRHEDCIRWYDEHFSDANKSAVTELALSYKGGSLFRLGRKKEAAYVFSKAFVRSVTNKRGHYTGFLWATEFCNQALLPDYRTLCKNDTERATMAALFALHGTEFRLDAIEKVYELDPASSLLLLLANREIHKLEEQYFTPLLNKEKGGKALYVSWGRVEEKAKAEGKTNDQEEVLQTAALFEKLMADQKLPQRGLYGAGAAYLRFMLKDFASAKAMLAKTGKAAGNEKLAEQTALISLLIAANEEKNFSKETETSLLPSMKWLVQKAKTDREYQLFCRNFFSQILAQQYEQQGDAVKAALAYGVADLAFIKRNEEEYWWSYPPAIDFVRNEMTTESLVSLYEVMKTPATDAEKFFIQHASFNRDEVVDAIGTSYLRDRNYASAIEWLNKAGKLEPLTETQYYYETDKTTTTNVDPFFDYLNDWQRFNQSVAKPYTKLSLAKKLLEMENRIKSGIAVTDKARLYYQYATALYNMSHYGNSWRALTYYRSGSEWNTDHYKLPWEKEYYGVYTAREFYQKAYQVATNKEFKAACLFMVAKCAQRQIPRPSFDYDRYEAYQQAEAVFQQKFQNNPLFQKFNAEFGTTKFYRYAYNRCSYLRDYLKQTGQSLKAPAKGKRKQ